MFYGSGGTLKIKDPSDKCADPRQHFITIKNFDLVLIDIPCDPRDGSAPAFPFQPVNNIILSRFESLYGHGKSVQMMRSFALKGNAPQLLAVLVQCVCEPVIFREGFQRGNTFDGIQSEAGEAFSSVHISAQVTPAAPCADKYLQRDADGGGYFLRAGAFQAEFHTHFLVHGTEKLQKNLILQCMYAEAVFYPESLVLTIHLIG